MIIVTMSVEQIYKQIILFSQLLLILTNSGPFLTQTHCVASEGLVNILHALYVLLLCPVYKFLNFFLQLQDRNKHMLI